MQRLLKALKRQKVLFVLLLLASLGPSLYLLSRRYPKPKNRPQQYSERLPSHFSAERPLIIFGDTQTVSSVERHILRRERNGPESQRLIELAAAEHPALVVIVGDLVFDASSVHHWADFDVLMKPLIDEKCPLLPVLGNHEYWGLNSWCADNIFQRFPELEKNNWYFKKIGGLALVVLNSNASELSTEQWQQQQQWLEKSLVELDQDSATRLVLVLAHHAPFTNSVTTEESRVVQESFVPLFYASRKAQLFISGHAHGYEHFKKKGRHFVVTAGAGGARFLLHQGSAQRHQDLFKGPAPRPFHYLRLIPGNQSLVVEVKGFDKKNRSLRVIERYEIPFPA